MVPFNSYECYIVTTVMSLSSTNLYVLEIGTSLLSLIYQNLKTSHHPEHTPFGWMYHAYAILADTHTINLNTKFECLVSPIWAAKFKSGSRDPNPPVSGAVIVGQDLLWVTYMHQLWSVSLHQLRYKHTKGDTTRRPASADRTARAANFRRDLEATN